MHARTLAAFGLAAGLAAGAATPVDAGPLDPKHLPADAKWIAHVNVEALAGSALGQLLLDSELGAHEARAQAIEALGFDPVTEVLGITVYGRTADPEPSAILVEATPAIDATIASLDDEESRPKGYRLVESEGRTAHFFGGGGGETYACVLEHGRNRIVVVADSLAHLHPAVDIVEGKGASLSDTDEGGLSLRGYKNALAFVETGEMNGSTSFAPASQILKAANGVSIRVVEEDDESTLFAMTLRTPDEKEARNLSDVLTGVIGMGRMMAAQQEELAPIADVLRSMAVRPDRNAISIDLRLHRDMIAAMLEATKPHAAPADHAHDASHGGGHDTDHGGSHDGEHGKAGAGGTP